MPDPAPPHRRWLRFSIRTLLVLMVVAASALAWKFNRVRAQQRAVAAIRQSGGWVIYDYEMWRARSVSTKPIDPPGPSWLRNLLGVDHFADVYQAGAGGEGLRAISSLPNLWLVNAEGVSDDDIDAVLRLPKLTDLSLEGTFTDASVGKLIALPGLKNLALNSQNLTNASLDNLQQFVRLAQLRIMRVRPREHEFSIEAIRRLEAALPECHVGVHEFDANDP